MTLAAREGVWGKKNPGLGRTEDQMKIEENTMIRTMKALNGEMEKTGDFGETADLLDILQGPADILPNAAIVASQTLAKHAQGLFSFHVTQIIRDCATGRSAPNKSSLIYAVTCNKMTYK